MTLFKRFPIVSALTLLAGAACGTPQGDITTPEVVNAAAADSAFVAALRAKLTTDVAAGCQDHRS